MLAFVFLILLESASGLLIIGAFFCLILILLKPPSIDSTHATGIKKSLHILLQPARYVLASLIILILMHSVLLLYHNATKPATIGDSNYTLLPK